MSSIVGPSGWGFWVWAAEGHPPHGGSDCIHICDTHCLISYNVAHAHGGDSGVVTTPMDRVLWGASEASSDGSCVHRQAVTPAKLHGGVLGWMTAKAHTGEEGLGGVRVSSRGAGGFDGLAQGKQIGPPLGIRALDGWGSPSSHHWSWGMQDFFPPQELWLSPLCSQLWCTGCLRDIGRHGFQALIILLGKGHSQEHLLIREGEVVFYFFPQFLHALSKQAWPPPSWWVNLLCPMLEGPGICYCFLLGDFSNVPAGIDGFGRWHKLLLMKAWWHRGAWRLASSICNSLILCRSRNKACTSLASLFWSSTSGTADNSAHQLGVSHLSAFHSTHWLNSVTVGSRGILSSSSSEVPVDPLKKDATSGPSSSGSSRSEPSAAAASSLDSVLGLEGQLGAGCSSNCTWQSLFFCSTLLCSMWSLLLDLTLTSRQVQVQLNLSISPLRAATAASAFGWATCTMAKLLSTKLSPFSFWEALLLKGWGSASQDLVVVADAPSSLCPWQSLREDTTSSSNAGSPGGDPGSLCSL